MGSITVGFIFGFFLPKQCYASILYAMARNCPSLRLSQAGNVSKQLNIACSFLAQKLISAYPAFLFYEGIWAAPIIRVLPLEFCPNYELRSNLPSHVDQEMAV